MRAKKILFHKWGTYWLRESMPPGMGDCDLKIIVISKAMKHLASIHVS